MQHHSPEEAEQLLSGEFSFPYNKPLFIFNTSKGASEIQYSLMWIRKTN
jgi:hypothetical protein